MSSKYLCFIHIKRILFSEAEALLSWSSMMQRGVNAYTKCRSDTAHTYLSAALDIALLRNECEENKAFWDIHIMKPAELLMQLHLLSEEYEQADLLLSRLVSISSPSGKSMGVELTSFLNQHYEYLKAARKEDFVQLQIDRVVNTLNTDYYFAHGFPAF